MDQHFKQEKSSLPKGTPVGVDDGSVEVKSFQPKTLNGSNIHSYEETKEKFGHLVEGDSKSDVRFNLHPAARKFLGIDHEEQRHHEVKIAEEVEKRLTEMKEQARQEGFELGMIEGERQAKDEFNLKALPVFSKFQQVLKQFEHAKDEIYFANEQFLIQLVFQVAKQVTLKEIKTDPEYVKNLCTLLVEKIGAKDHVRIKIGRDDFTQVEAIRDYLKTKFVDLKNIQIDVSDEFINGGCKVETDLARINASVDTQLSMIKQALGEK